MRKLQLVLRTGRTALNERRGQKNLIIDRDARIIIASCTREDLQNYR